MRNRELQERLRKFPDNMDIKIRTPEDDYDIENVLRDQSEIVIILED